MPFPTNQSEVTNALEMSDPAFREFEHGLVQAGLARARQITRDAVAGLGDALAMSDAEFAKAERLLCAVR